MVFPLHYISQGAASRSVEVKIGLGCENIAKKKRKNRREELSLITSHPIPRYHFSDASDSAFA